MKRRAVQIFLVLFALWPLAHRGLVAAYDVNPWKLAGWAMYTRPWFPTRVELAVLRGGEERPVRRMTEWERTLLEEYVERRFSIGRLASPRRLAETLLANRGRADAVVLHVTTRRLDLETARIAERAERLVFRRGPGGEAIREPGV